MIRLQTPVQISPSRMRLGYDTSVVMLGSCFSDSIGQKMQQSGFDVCINPFGTLYNPVSIRNSVERLIGARPFTGDECVMMGAGSSLVCSFSHHTSFARKTEDEFLCNANASLEIASAAFAKAGLVIITLGTSWCYFLGGTDQVVSNCLKRNASEFERKMIPVSTSVSVLEQIVEMCPDKKFIFTVSPIRHMADGATGNLVSKASLVLAVSSLVERYPDRVEYFPSYEIMMDELRDYRFYAEDMVHPSDLAVNYIWERFGQWCISEKDRQTASIKEKEYRQSQHRQIHR